MAVAFSLAFVHGWKLSLVLLFCMPVVVIAFGLKAKITEFLDKEIKSKDGKSEITKTERDFIDP